MANPIASLVRRWRFGEPIVVVSGLPRSGTSMAMRMLEAGGLTVMTDEVREADEDNPRGYYELERVKNLEEETDKSWLRQARGRVIKVISHLLEHLPDDNAYRVILMRRDLDEVLASQNKMLTRRGEDNPIEDDRAKDLYERHLRGVRGGLSRRKCFEMLELRYDETLADPTVAAAAINRFLGGALDEARMSAVVEKNLYRNRKDELASAGEATS